MGPIRRQTLTQEELVTDLRQLGYVDASVTRVATWRKLDLLPPFSSGGRGQGRGVGRDKQLWSNPADVLNQAVWIMDLLKAYRRLEDLYVPLWQLGYPIPLDRVRPALTQPLLTVAKDFDVQVDGRSAVEDEIDDAAVEIMALLQRKHLTLFDVPAETMAAAVNVLVNPKYDLKDQPYEEGVSELKKWEHSFSERCTKLLGDAVNMNPAIIADGKNIFTNAPFINQYLSLPHLLTAVKNCTDEDLMVVQRDLHLGREILRVFKQILELLSPFLPEWCRSLPDDMTVCFNVGLLAIWADLALRSSGFGPLIDQLVPEILKVLHEDFNEVTACEIQADGPDIGKALQMVEQLMIAEMSAPGSIGD